MKNPIDEIEHFLSFDNTRDSSSYEERVGTPDELSAVMGRITMNFQYLENRIEKIITEQFLDLEKDIGMILTAELSFKNKVNLFASLFYKINTPRRFNLVKDYELEHFKLLIKAVYRCEELRNTILHSNISKNWKSKEIIRTKTTAKSKKGLSVVNEVVDIPYLFDVSDYMNQVEFNLRDSFDL
nr:hypothetical protein [uncultured Allomuricauda sp.]